MIEVLTGPVTMQVPFVVSIVYFTVPLLYSVAPQTILAMQQAKAARTRRKGVFKNKVLVISEIVNRERLMKIQ